MKPDETSVGMATGRAALVEKHRDLTFQEFKRRCADGSMTAVAERMDSRIHHKGQVGMAAAFMACYQVLPFVASALIAFFAHSWLYMIAPVVGLILSPYPASGGLGMCVLLGCWIAAGTSGRPWFSLGLPSWTIYTGLTVIWDNFWSQMSNGAIHSYTEYNLVREESLFIRARDEGIAIFVDRSRR